MREQDKKMVIYFRESLWQSICADVFTFGLLGFCIWFSAGSKFWNFVCFAMLFLSLCAKFPGERKKIFRSYSDLKAFLDKEV